MAKKPNEGGVTEAQARAAADTARKAPQGQRVGRPGGPGNLWPGAGKVAAKTDTMVFCGEIMGVAYDFMEHPNSKDATKISTRFMGEFLLVPAPESGQVQRVCNEVYLPGVVERALKSQLKKGIGDVRGLPVAVEIWAEPDAVSGSETITGYQYAVYNRIRPSANDALWVLAQATGIGTVPALAAPAQARAITGGSTLPDNVDPETGEVLPDTAAA